MKVLWRSVLYMNRGEDVTRGKGEEETQRAAVLGTDRLAIDVRVEVGRGKRPNGERLERVAELTCRLFPRVHATALHHSRRIK